MIDTQGGGIKRMFQAQRRRFFPMPDYDLSQPERVVVSIQGRILDERYTRLLMARTDLGLRTIMLMDRVQKNQLISPEDNKRLKADKLVEGRYPNLVVAAAIAAATGQKAEHIRDRGLNSQYYRDLIVELIRKHQPVTREDIDRLLLDKLPEVLSKEQKLTKIHNLLTSLSGKRIRNDGARGKRTLSETCFEDVVMAALAASPQYSVRDASYFDAATLLDADQLWDFIEATQPNELAKLHQQFPDAPRGEALAAHIMGLIEKRGTLEVLRNGVSFSGINLHLAYFRPSAGGNPQQQAGFEGNCFAVIRQVHFSTKTPDQSADGVILLNGLPIVSVELKNHFTWQNVQRAIAQYRRRDKNEPFWRRCLVHFAVDDDAAYMTTRLAGPDTAFLPLTATPTIRLFLTTLPPATCGTISSTKMERSKREYGGQIRCCC